MFFDNIDLYGSVPQPDFDLAIPWFWPGTSDPNSPIGHVLDSLATINGGTGHVWDDYLRRQSQYWALRGDYTTQWNPHHQLKGGFEYRQIQSDFQFLGSTEITYNSINDFIDNRPAAAASSGASVQEFDAFRAQTTRNLNTLQSQIQNLAISLQAQGLQCLP